MIPKRSLDSVLDKSIILTITAPNDNAKSISVQCAPVVRTSVKSTLQMPKYGTQYARPLAWAEWELECSEGHSLSAYSVVKDTLQRKDIKLKINLINLKLFVQNQTDEDSNVCTLAAQLRATALS